MLEKVEFGPWLVMLNPNENVPLLFRLTDPAASDKAAPVLKGCGSKMVLPCQPPLPQVNTQPWVTPFPMKMLEPPPGINDMRVSPFLTQISPEGSALQVLWICRAMDAVLSGIISFLQFFRAHLHQRYGFVFPITRSPDHARSPDFPFGSQFGIAKARKNISCLLRIRS